MAAAVYYRRHVYRNHFQRQPYRNNSHVRECGKGGGTITFGTPYSLTNGTAYAMVLNYTGGNSTNYFSIGPYTIGGMDSTHRQIVVLAGRFNPVMSFHLRPRPLFPIPR